MVNEKEILTQDEVLHTNKQVEELMKTHKRTHQAEEMRFREQIQSGADRNELYDANTRKLPATYGVPQPKVDHFFFKPKPKPKFKDEQPQFIFEQELGEQEVAPKRNSSQHWRMNESEVVDLLSDSESEGEKSPEKMLPAASPHQSASQVKENSMGVESDDDDVLYMGGGNEMNMDQTFNPNLYKPKFNSTMAQLSSTPSRPEFKSEPHQKDEDVVIALEEMSIDADATDATGLVIDEG